MNIISKRGMSLLVFFVFLLSAASPIPAQVQDLLKQLGQHQNYTSKRISSFDRTGGNNDRLSIEPGKTAVLAEINGPAAIHHIWVTISAGARLPHRFTLARWAEW